MPKQNSSKALAISICKAVHELNGNRLHWLGINDLCKHMKIQHNKAFREAVEYAKTEELLSCSPPPVHSVMLTHKGELAARAPTRKSRSA